MRKTLAEQFADYATSLRWTDLSSSVIHEVKRRVIDSLGCALGAWRAAPCAIARSVASGFSAQRGATLLGTRRQTTPDWAAFANGCLIRYLDYNDTYLSKEPAHPSDNISAGLATAEAAGSTGREFIIALALAYEIQCRLCDVASLRARGWDHVTYGAFSSALAAARLLRLDHERTRHAVGIAGVASAALRQSRVGELSHWKGCAFANAARHGVFAALLARAGMTGPAPIFEGANGFEKLVSGPLDCVPLSKTRFMILKTSLKFWPAEYHSQSAIAAALELRPYISNIKDVESIVIESHDAAVDIIGREPEKWRPSSRETADHSLPYIVAVALSDGEVTTKQFDPSRFRDPTLLALVKRVSVRRNAELSAQYPESTGNIVTASVRGQSPLSARVDFPRGHARNPMTDTELESKFHALADAPLGPRRANALLRWLWQLEKVPNVDRLFRLLEVKQKARRNKG